MCEVNHTEKTDTVECGGLCHSVCLEQSITFSVLNGSQMVGMCKNRLCGVAYCLSHCALFILVSTHCVLQSCSPFKLEGSQVCDWI